VSLTEIIEAVKALPRADKVRLLHALVEDVGGPPEVTPEEALLAKYFPPGATTFEVWFPEANPHAVAAAAQALAERKGA
jgi:hypothetical protein